MQIGISNILWDEQSTSRLCSIAKNTGFKYIESAYSKINKTESIAAIQSLFYKTTITSFSDPKCYSHLCTIVDYAHDNSIDTIILGSPSMRTGNKKYLIDLLKIIDIYLNDKNCTICIEPNSMKYGAEYYYDIQSIVDDINNFNNIKTMVDTGNMIMEGLDPLNMYQFYSDFIYHVHLSQDKDSLDTDYKLFSELIELLKEYKYNKKITYENSRLVNDIEYDMKLFYEKVCANGMETI